MKDVSLPAHYVLVLMNVISRVDGRDLKVMS